MVKLYDLIEILKDKYVFIVDLKGLGIECQKDEVRNRFNNDTILEISSDFSQSDNNDVLNFVHIDGYCKNED